MSLSGKCKFFNAPKGWGILTRDDNGEDVFVHYTQIQKEGFRRLNEGETVWFDVETYQPNQQTQKECQVNVTGKGDGERKYFGRRGKGKGKGKGIGKGEGMGKGVGKGKGKGKGNGFGQQPLTGMQTQYGMQPGQDLDDMMNVPNLNQDRNGSSRFVRLVQAGQQQQQQAAVAQLNAQDPPVHSLGQQTAPLPIQQPEQLEPTQPMRIDTPQSNDEDEDLIGLDYPKSRCA